MTAWRDPEGDVHVSVERWLLTEEVPRQFVVRATSARMVWNYLWRVGLATVWRKWRSRVAERERNERACGIGVGTVIGAPAGTAPSVGDRVVFVAPNHSTKWSVLTLDRRLVAAVEDARSEALVDDERVRADLRTVAGWTRSAGKPLEGEVTIRLLAAARDGAGPAPPAPPSPPRRAIERWEATRAPSGRPTAVILGLGNYAKTQILPVALRRLDLRAVHEIDPDQLLAAAGTGAALDTCPHVRATERYDAWFIAGYHHTHARLSADALRAGAYAICEKPVATTRADLELVRAALLSGDGVPRLIACFHRRYSELTRWALEDLWRDGAESIDMHCLVYEIPLPDLHWYNWPSSGSRLISNGCHWIDLFLYLNRFAACESQRVSVLRGRDLSVELRLVNGAVFTMSLTDAGSERLGVRDVIELRSGDVTATLRDATFYEAEDSRRIIRRARRNPMRAYRTMYESVCRRIVAGEAGDPPSWLASSELVLALEEELVSTARDRGAFRGS